MSDDETPAPPDAAPPPGDHAAPAATDAPGAHDEATIRANERRRLRASTIVFALATAISRVAGLVREIFTAAVFSTGTTYSAFVVANQIPNLLRSLVADAALSAAFVPVFTDLDERGERERAWRVAGTVCSVILLVLGPLTVLAMVAAPAIVTPFVDSTFSAADVQLTIQLARLLMPIVLILALSGVIVGILNSYGRFGAAAMAPVAWNAVILMSLVVAVWWFPADDRIWVYAVGMVVGTVVQAVLPVPWLRGLGGRLRLRAAFRDPKVLEVFLLMLPVTIALGLINVQQFISALLAAHVDANVGAGFSGLDAGAGPAVLDKAFRVYMLPQGIFSVAVSTVVFPTLARMASRDDRTGFAQTVDQGLRQILMLLVPSSVFIGMFSVPIVRVLYEHGRWTPPETQAVALVLAAFAFGLTFNGLTLMLVRSLFSLRLTWLPTLASIVTLATNLAIALAAYQTWGVLGIALATSAANVVGVVVLYAMLARRTEPLGTARTALIGAGTLVSAMVAVTLPWIAYHYAWEPTFGAGFLPDALAIIAALAIAVPTYFALGVRMHAVRPGLVRDLRRGRG